MQSYIDQHQIYKKQRNLRIKIYLGIFFVILLFVSILYIVIYSPVFKVRETKITGNQRLSNEQVLNILNPLALETRIKNFLGTGNLLSWNKKHVDVSKTALLEANIRRDWLRQNLEMNIKERPRLAIWCDTSDNCYWIDFEGMMFEEAPQTEGSLILTIYDDRSESIIKGTKIVEERFIGNLTKLIKNIAKLKMPIKRIVFSKRIQEIKVETYTGPNLLFSIRFDPTLNMASLQNIEGENGFNEIEYIDLRVENRIFYKNL